MNKIKTTSLVLAAAVAGMMTGVSAQAADAGKIDGKSPSIEKLGCGAKDGDKSAKDKDAKCGAKDGAKDGSKDGKKEGKKDGKNKKPAETQPSENAPK